MLMPHAYVTSVSRYSFLHPRRSILLWIVGLALLVGLGATVGGDLTTDATFTSHPESRRADDLLVRSWSPGDNADDFPELLVVRSTTRTLDDPGYRSVVQELVAAIEGPDQTRAPAYDPKGTSRSPFGPGRNLPYPDRPYGDPGRW